MTKEDLERVVTALVQGGARFGNPVLRAAARSLREEAANWLAADGIEGISVSERIRDGKRIANEWTIRIYVGKKLELGACQKPIPKRIDIPGIGRAYTDVVQSEPMEGFALSDPVNRLRPGYSVGRRNQQTGSIGVMVPRQFPRYLIGCSHVLANCGAALFGDPIVQPGPMHNQGRSVARLSRFRRLRSQGYGIDLAAARVNDDVPSSAIIPIVNIAPRRTKSARRGMRVIKVGAASERSTSTVQEENIRRRIRFTVYENGTPRRRVFGISNLFLCDAFARGGDSGGPVIDAEGNLVGLIVGGNSSETVALHARKLRAFVNELLS